MRLQPKIKNVISLAINLFIVLNMIITVANFFLKGGGGNMAVKGWTAFRYYTIDSNVLCALGCMAVLPHNIKALKTGKLVLGENIFLFKYAGTVAVTVTFLIVVLFLGPTQGYKTMFDKSVVFMHGVNPILAIIGFLFESTEIEFTRKKALWGCISVFAYGTIYAVMVVFLKTWQDFYGFTSVAKWWISYLLMMLFGYLVSIGVRGLYRLINKK